QRAVARGNPPRSPPAVEPPVNRLVPVLGAHPPQLRREKIRGFVPVKLDERVLAAPGRCCPARLRASRAALLAGPPGSGGAGLRRYCPAAARELNRLDAAPLRCCPRDLSGHRNAPQCDVLGR